MLKKTLLLILILEFLISCQSNDKNQIKNIENEKLLNLAYNKLVKKFEDNKFTETDANEAFLLAKTFENEENLEKALKLLELQYQFTPTIPSALSLIQINIILKNLNDAKELAKNAYTIFPNNIEILINLIEIYQLEGNIPQVINLLSVGQKKFPKNEQIAILNAYYNKLEAKTILQNFIKNNPNSPNVLLKLSSLYFLDKNYNESLKYAKKSLSYDSRNKETIFFLGVIHKTLKNYNEAEKYYKLAFEKDMENNITAQSYVNILLLQKKKQEALSVLLKLEASSDSNVPFPPEFIYQIGRILLINEDYQGAKKRFESLLDPQFFNKLNENEIYFFLAYTYENLHLFKEAIEYFEKINKNSPIYLISRREKIITLINYRKESEAIKEISDYKIEDSAYLPDTIFKSSILSYFNLNNEALELLNQAIEKNPKVQQFYLKRIDIYLKMKKNINFIFSECKKIIKKWPNYSDASNTLGYLLVKNEKDLNYAEKLIKLSLKSEADNPSYLDSLGMLYLKKKKYELAQLYFINALKFKPNDPIILYHYLQTLQLLKNDIEASKIIEKTRTIITNMLIYNFESDEEVKHIADELNIIRNKS
jgi:tetratricopeptide (TPR) repeat protein